MISNRGLIRSRTAFVGAAAALALVVSMLAGSLPAAHAQGTPEALALSAGTNFNSSFGSNHDGWKPVFGTWKLTSAGTYKTVAPFQQLSSVRHSGTYKNFIFTAKVKAAGTSIISPVGLFVRGNPSILDSHHFWNSAYVFYYSNDGYAFIHKWLGGVPSILGFAAPIPAINQDGWNVLKVVAYGGAFAFYINGVEAGGFYDPGPLTTGAVGIGMYGDGTHTLMVDWAKLSIISGDVSPFGGMAPALAPTLSLGGAGQTTTP